MAPPKKRTSESVAETPKPKKLATSTNFQKYTLGEKILAKSGNQFYEAKIIDLRDDGYFIHYQNWNKRYDELVSEAEAQTKFRKFDEETLKAVKEEEKEARRSSSAAKTPKSKVIVKKESIDLAADESDAESAPKTSKTRKIGTPAASKTSKANISKRSAAIKAEPSDKADTPTVSGIQTLKTNTVDPEYVKEITDTLYAILLDKSTTNALVDVLAEDRERVYRRQKLPKTPAEFTIIKIMQEFLKNQDVEMENMSDLIPDEFENALVPAKYELEEMIKCLINLFDCTAQAFLLYPIEKELFEELAKGSGETEGNVSNGKTNARFSNRVGLPYLIRMLSRMNIILGSGLLDADVVNNFLSIVKELGPFLSKNQKRFYNPEEYYETPHGDYLKRFEKIVE
ncbi:Mortality factor 4-like protein 1 [Aphelenchoides besseyi]|nr:Mortality factor 4-like protein 1 [Aphelenchoides besseyi]KAI6194377.1 Mortality factor 4-like protein 1 [Aphelenchoides besseyi]